jgi:DDE superfamily endonuclease
MSGRAAGGRAFPPSVVVEIKALACELPARRGLPLARWSCAELRREVVAQGLVAEISGTTLRRWLGEDPRWRHRSWIFPRDPDFAAKAGRILDLYHRRRNGAPLGPRDYVLSADEKNQHSSAQAQTSRAAPSQRPPDLPRARICGAWAYIAAWDVHRAKLFGRCERKTGIAPFGRLVAQVMRQEPYRSARRAFWIDDNGSSHRGTPAIARLKATWPNLILIHTPVHATWLNQSETSFTIVQRTVVTPNDFPDLAAVKDRLLSFQQRYQASAKPFRSTFTRRDLHAMLTKSNLPLHRLAA